MGNKFKPNFTLLQRVTMKLASFVSDELNAQLWRKYSKFDVHADSLVERNVSVILKRINGKNGVFIDCGVNEGYILEKYVNRLENFRFFGFEIQLKAF